MPETDETTIERYCQVCTRTPVTVDGKGNDQTCATCLNTVRTHIKAIGIMATALLSEALVMNLNSNAAALAGPVADPETWGYRRRAVLAQRVDKSWLDDQVDMHHPLWVLATWEREARIHLEQTLSPGTSMPTLTEAREYLDGHLTRLAQDADFAFKELADDVELCHNHVERVLHLELHIDRGAPCPNCPAREAPNLKKDYGTTEAEDRWSCPRCHEWWSNGDYRNRISDDILANHLATAKRLTANEIEIQYRVPASTIRTWVQRDLLEPHKARDRRGRQLFTVASILALRDAHTEDSATA